MYDTLIDLIFFDSHKLLTALMMPFMPGRIPHLLYPLKETTCKFENFLKSCVKYVMNFQETYQKSYTRKCHFASAVCLSGMTPVYAGLKGQEV